jgi:hypothetical protein
MLPMPSGAVTSGPPDPGIEGCRRLVHFEYLSQHYRLERCHCFPGVQVGRDEFRKKGILLDFFTTTTGGRGMGAFFRQWLYIKRAERVIRNLERNGIEGFYFEQIPKGAVVGLGDSLTLKQTATVAILEQDRYRLLASWKENNTEW